MRRPGSFALRGCGGRCGRQRDRPAADPRVAAPGAPPRQTALGPESPTRGACRRRNTRCEALGPRALVGEGRAPALLPHHRAGKAVVHPALATDDDLARLPADIVEVQRTTSPARRPSRANKSSIASVRRPRAVERSVAAMTFSTSSGVSSGGTAANRHRRTGGTAVERSTSVWPSRNRKRRNERSAAVRSLTNETERFRVLSSR